MYSEPSSGVAHSGHVLWLIRDAPRAAILGTPHGQIDPHRDADGYIAGKDAWATHLEREPTNVTFLGHAASFYGSLQDRDVLIETREKAERVRSRVQLPDGFDPEDPRLPAGVSELLERRSAGQASIAGRALEHLRRAYELAFELCSNFWPSDKLKDWAALSKAAARRTSARIWSTELVMV